MNKWSWTDSGRTLIIHSEDNKHERGVGITFDEEAIEIVKGLWDISDQVELVHLKRRPRNVNIAQTYAPNLCSDEDIQIFYNDSGKSRSHTKSSEVNSVTLMSSQN